MTLWSALIVGFFGSVHCAVMCGPIALSLPLTAAEKGKALLEIGVYNAGRIITYMMIGLLVGLFGRSFFYSGHQQWLSIGAGVVIVLAVIVSLLMPSVSVWFANALPWRTTVMQYVGKWWQRGGLGSHLMIGVFNGFLPCGLVYVAVAGAFVQYDAARAVGYMAVFGAGTLPMMLAVTLFGKGMLQRLKLKTLTPYLALLMGILFIIRGMQLGIPYVSPKIVSQSTEVMCR